MKLVIDTDKKTRFSKNEAIVILEQLVKRGIGSELKYPLSHPEDKNVTYDRFSSAWFIAMHVFDNVFSGRSVIHEMVDDMLGCLEYKTDRFCDNQILFTSKELREKYNFSQYVEKYLTDLQGK